MGWSSERWLARLFDMVFAVSGKTLDDWVARWGADKIFEHSIYVTPNGAEKSPEQIVLLASGDQRYFELDDPTTDSAINEKVRTSLGNRIAEVFGFANRAQETADAAMARNVVCVTRTLNRTRAGACDPGYTLTGCTQTRYTRRAGGMAILRSVNDTECRFNGQVLEVQVRCCAMGPNPPPATMVRDTAPPAPQTQQPTPVSKQRN